MAKASDNLFPKLKLGPAGTTPAAPSDSSWTMYSMANGVFARSSNTTVGPFGTGGAGTTVATDTIWDAAGDLAVGSGADTAARLAIGASGTRLGSNGTTASWSYPPGYEFDYTAKTADVTINGTAEGSANSIVTSGSVTYDGSTAVYVEYFSPRVSVANNASNNAIVILLYEDSTLLGRIGLAINPAGATSSMDVPFIGKYRLTPTNAAHTYTVKAYRTNADSVIYHGSGGSGNQLPGYIRVSKA